MPIYEKVSLQIMDKKVINEKQFRKLVIEEAKKYISEEEVSAENVKSESKRKVTFDKVESLINEMEGMNKSISSLSMDIDKSELIGSPKSEDTSSTWTPNKNRDLDVNEHNSKKNVNRMNEEEKGKWNRMMNYNIPSDEER